ncbi:MAG TPA: hypothetical protein VG938_16010 [Verrucomicrobiae bacterium]|jgi:hypothetical protein|nr:hypothetical protein [Verrucomicrobiae bacterium]
MSLGKLLNTGKSLVGLHNAGGRYHLQKGALPKFESSKNPFATRAHEVEPEREPQLPKLTPAELAAAKLKKTQALPVLSAKAEAPSRNTEPAQPTKPAPVVESWLKKINPLVWLRNSKPAQPKSAIPRFGKGPVQGELSLENIKVMRNDLSETDLEAVPMKVRHAKPAPVAVEASAAVMAIPELPPATNAWEYLGERLLGKH